jgi:Xaa-Pro aminopeptidase
MQIFHVDAYVVPSGDAHQSEYVADYWQARAWLSGFTGSAGVLVVTATHAGLWTDSRYFLQAASELAGTEVVLHKLVVPHTPEHLDWMLGNLPEKAKVGMDGRQFSVSQLNQLERRLEVRGMTFQTELDLVGMIWETRPPLPSTQVFEHPVEFAGLGRTEKLRLVRSRMEDQPYYLISTLDDIAWLFNLRGSDVPCNPVFYAHAIIGREQAWLFVDPGKIPDSIRAGLSADGIVLLPYEGLAAFLRESLHGPVRMDPAGTDVLSYRACPAQFRRNGDNIVAALKAVKHSDEIRHLRHAMEKDGVAMVRFFRWLETNLAENGLTESMVATVLSRYRSEQPHAMGDSFQAIVGYGANGAIVHYTAEAGLDASLAPAGILLLDSGGQYLDGTTDITRTVALGPPTDLERRDFTLVLKGHIALASAVFPAGTTGVQLDILARMPLWQELLNYGHGTGHGVGYFLNVHEGPQGIAPVSSAKSNTALVPGMILSNEPGIYREGMHGIRTENLVLCTPAGESDFGNFLCFETLSLFPIDRNLVDSSLLLPSEADWLNRYHAMVYDKLSPHLTEEERDWLAGLCRPV